MVGSVLSSLFFYLFCTINIAINLEVLLDGNGENLFQKIVRVCAVIMLVGICAKEIIVGL